jgi:light-regulated signal transduction histidine kinase (bacteriophytochrome)
MAANGRLATETSLAMNRKLAELEAANRVNTQRTGMLVSLHDISQTLISSTDLHELASRVCRHAREICHADRAILYYLHDDRQAEILAANGLGPDWNTSW